MGRKQSDPLPSMQMTSMIDIIFQLLIFFLVTLSMGTVQEQASSKVKGEQKVNLPELPPVEKLSDVPELTDGYMLWIEQDKNNKVDGDLAVYILDPIMNNIDDAQKDSSGQYGPFSLQQGSRNLKTKINDEIALGEAPPPLFIVAHAETPFGFVLDIMRFCNEDSIEAVNFSFSNIKTQ